VGHDRQAAKDEIVLSCFGVPGVKPGTSFYFVLLAALRKRVCLSNEMSKGIGTMQTEFTS
jgi:hypothetical protein